MNTFVNYSFYGSVIKYYRKQLKVKQKDFVLNDNGLPICSCRTLRRLESGKYKEYSNLLNILVEKLGFTFNIHSPILFEISEYRDRLMELFIYDLPIYLYEELYRKMKISLSTNISFFYYSQILRAYIALVELHLYGTLKDQNILNVLDETYSYLENDDLKIVKILLFKACRYQYIHHELLDHCEEMKDLCGHPLFRYEEIYFDMLYTNYSYIQIYEKYTKLDADDLLTKTDSYIYFVLSSLAFSEVNTNAEMKAYIHLTKLIKIISKEKDFKQIVPYHQILQLHKRAGIVSFKLKEYQKCI